MKSNVEKVLFHLFCKALKEAEDDAFFSGGEQCYQDIDPWGQPLTNAQRRNAAERLAEVNKRLAWIESEYGTAADVLGKA